mgnify:CR=1 FL=1
MMRTSLQLAVVMSLLAAGTTRSPATEQPAVWSVDPLVKVFPDDTPETPGRPYLGPQDVARGEHASLQVVVRAAAGVTGLSAVAGPLEHQDDPGAELHPAAVRFVGYVPVDRPIPDPPSDQLRKPPADFPDPLLETATLDVPAGRAQPIWVTVPVPAQAPCGLYRGTLELTWKSGEKDGRARCPLEIRVHDVTVGRTRLWVTNWFHMHWPHMAVQPEPGSPEYWELLRRYARNMADHRQNVAMIGAVGLAGYRVGPGDTLEIDFTTFDRWVTIFKEEGVIGRIEGAHLGGRAGDWTSPFVVHIRRIQDGRVVEATVDPSSPEADAFFAVFLPALVRHLREKGWLDIYMQHLGDEPIQENLDSYRAMAALVRRHAPELRIIEACLIKDLAGSIDVWVPVLGELHQQWEHYAARQQAGEEVWFYTCVSPQGEYANRFIEQPLIKTRLLHWINYRYGLTGYLHWGYNAWTAEDPFRKLTRDHGSPAYLPAGDSWIVYPGKNGPLDSIRFEAMRDGIVDHELLSMLAGKDKAAAMRLAERHVLAFDRYDTDVARFRATRRELLEALARR